METLAELRRVDDRVLRFTPMGLASRGGLRPEAAAEYLQQIVAQFNLSDAVATGTRSSFEDLRTVFVHGLFCYEIFTLVNDRALLVFEQALRDRFIEYHRGTVTFVDSRTGAHHEVPATSYAQVSEALRNHRSWQLLLPDGRPIAFNAMLSGLRTWARELGMLRGQRNRRIEDAITGLRNLVAHPGGYHLTTPVDAARTLSNLAEIINHLWGATTRGGRLYSAPVRREVVVLTWDAAGQQMQIAPAQQLTEAADPADRSSLCVILRAVFRADRHVTDPGLYEYDARHEVTQYPTDLLWGPGSTAEAAAWFAQHQPEPDECDYLDRTFFIRHDGTDLYLPMRPAMAAALSGPDRSGRWYAIKADEPNDAFHHVRNLLAGTCRAGLGPCRQCHIETLDQAGLYRDVVAARGPAPGLSPAANLATALPDVTTPWAQRRSITVTTSEDIA
jgi:hypothetical protein